MGCCICALLGGFAIGARVSLFNAKCHRVLLYSLYSPRGWLSDYYFVPAGERIIVRRLSVCLSARIDPIRGTT